MPNSLLNRSNQYIWLIGGTSESAEVARSLVGKNIACLITVTTESARSLYPQLPYFEVVVGKLNQQEIKAFLRERSIKGIVDASHPYATEISQRAIAVASQQNLPYLRYERPSLIENEGENRLANFATLLQGNYLTGQRVLLTVGYQALPLFQPWQNQATLFARILPSLESLQVALKAGFTNHRLIAIRPPLSRELEKALWQQWEISLVVTKASGKAGGEALKRSLSQELGIPLITIARPKVTYPQQTSYISEVSKFCQRLKN
ncbi:MAG: cobalt-precorrin-6A reductase [Spirulinaceae cyanobacterium]